MGAWPPSGLVWASPTRLSASWLLGGWMQARWLWPACEGVSAWSPGSLPELTCTPRPPCCQLGWSSSVLWMISPLQTLWRQQASLPCRPSLVLLVVLRSSLAGPTLPLQTQAACSEAEGLAALSPVPRASGHQSPAGNIVLFLLLAAGVFCSFSCTHLRRFLNVVF